MAIAIEKKRGFQEASSQFAVLRAKWPQAFPDKGYEVRPLASGGVRILTEALGWSHPYARAVLMARKLREPYCRAVLRDPRRINLDGSASGEEIDDKARAQAREQLGRIAARKAKRAELLARKEEGAAAATPEP